MPAAGALTGLADIEPCAVAVGVAAGAPEWWRGNTWVKVGCGVTCGCTSRWPERRTSFWAAQAAWPG